MCLKHADFAAAIKSADAFNECRQAILDRDFRRIESEGLGVEVREDESRFRPPWQGHVDVFIETRIESTARTTPDWSSR